MHLIVCADPVEATDRAAGLILEQRLACECPLPVGLATGRTMEPLYRALAERVSALQPGQRLQLQRGWSSFNLDEYLGVPAVDPRSFAAFMAHHLVEPFALDPG